MQQAARDFDAVPRSAASSIGSTPQDVAVRWLTAVDIDISAKTGVAASAPSLRQDGTQHSHQSGAVSAKTVGEDDDWHCHDERCSSGAPKGSIVIALRRGSRVVVRCAKCRAGVSFQERLRTKADDLLNLGTRHAAFRLCAIAREATFHHSLDGNTGGKPQEEIRRRIVGAGWTWFGDSVASGQSITASVLAVIRELAGGSNTGPNTTIISRTICRIASAAL
jgi:hypothetical protein